MSVSSYCTGISSTLSSEKLLLVYDKNHGIQLRLRETGGKVIKIYVLS